MYALIVLGRLIETTYGSGRFLAFYIYSCVISMLASTYYTKEVAVGASGALSGLFGVLCVFAILHRGFIIPRRRFALWLNLLFVIVAMIGIGIFVPNIDNSAHAGGFVTGSLLGLISYPRTSLNAWSVSRRASSSLWALPPAFLLALTLLKIADVALEQSSLLSRPVPLVTHNLPQHSISLGLPPNIKEKRSGNSYQFVLPGSFVLSISVLDPAPHTTVRSVAEQYLSEISTRSPHELISSGSGKSHPNSWELIYRVYEGARPARYLTAIIKTRDHFIVLTFGTNERRFSRLANLFRRILDSLTFPGSRPTIPVEHDYSRSLERGIELLSEGRPDEALGYLQEATRSPSLKARSYTALAVLYLSPDWKGRSPATALYYTNKALRLSGETPQLLLLHSRALAQTGSLLKAMRTLNRAIERYPDEASLKEELRRLQSIQPP